MTGPAPAARVEGYEGFFGLNEPPFSLAPDPRFLFDSKSHSDALAQVAYALDRREPLVVITGEIGTGKTLLCRTVLQQLRRKTFLSVIGDPLLERDELLKQLLEDFGVISKDRSRIGPTTRHDLFHALEAFLSSLAPIQAHAVVIIDEAQHLQPDVLEEVRLLSNVDDERGTLLQIILVGQPDLDALLARPELRQLEQRVTRRLRLEPLNRDEVNRYITHRLALARRSAKGDLANQPAFPTGPVEFAPNAVQAVSELSGGLPRVINLLCDRALEDAFTGRRRTIDGPSIHAAATALGISGAVAPPIAPPQQTPDAAVAPSVVEVVEAPPPVATVAPVPVPVPMPPPITSASELLAEIQASVPPEIDTSFWNATRGSHDAATANRVQHEDETAAIEPAIAAATRGEASLRDGAHHRRSRRVWRGRHLAGAARVAAARSGGTTEPGAASIGAARDHAAARFAAAGNAHAGAGRDSPHRRTALASPRLRLHRPRPSILFRLGRSHRRPLRHHRRLVPDRAARLVCRE